MSPNNSNNKPTQKQPLMPEYEYNEITGEIEIKKAGQDNKETQTNKQQETVQSYVRYSSLGFQMLAAMLLGAFGGLQLDKWFNTSPWLTVLLTLLGVGMAMFIVIREVSKK